MFDAVYRWVCSIWEWICPPRSSGELSPMVVEWDNGYGYPPAPTGLLYSNSDPNMIRGEVVYAGSSTGAVAFEDPLPHDFELEI